MAFVGGWDSLALVEEVVDMEILIQQYGALGIGVIILFQLFNVQTRILKIEMKLDNYDQRLSKLEQKRKK